MQRLTFVAALASMTAMSCPAQVNHPQIVGVWRGNSVCAVQNGPYHSENNLYRISEVKGKRNEFTVTGSKIVDGRETVMGTSEWHYDQETHTLTSQGPAGDFRLTINGPKMEGSLTLQDHTVYRRIYLQKEP
jgi:hypothetical protein